MRALKILAVLAACAVAEGCSSPSGPGSGFGTNDPNVYVALGDSITAGQGDTGTGLSCPPPGSDFGYPRRLEELLGATVINEGECGAHSVDGAARVETVLARHRPGYLLILFSPNDINTSSRKTVSNLRTIIRAAQDNRTIPVIGTLTPAFDSHSSWEPYVEFINIRIRNLAASERVEVADHWVDFDMDAGLITSDGLHPNNLGYDRMAWTWYAAIQRTR